MEIVVLLIVNSSKVQVKFKDKKRKLKYQIKLKNHKTTRILHKKQNGGCGSFDG
jgi:hypothetical protein